jgi:predicted Zn-dependent peptidase
VFPASVLSLDNGLTLIHQEIATTPVVVADVWVRAGATVEPKQWFGMAHFLEHMIFKGTATLPPGMFDYNIEARGGVSNAATSYDYAHYTLTTAASYLEETLPQLGELLINAAIPDDEFIRERDVVLEEIRSCHDNPDWLGFQALNHSVYKNHPYGRSVLGTKGEVMQLSPAAMRCFHRAHYQPENMTVVVVGGISQEAAWQIVNQSFTDFAPPLECPPCEKIVEPIIRGINRQELCFPRLEQARLMMAWVVPGVKEIHTAYGLDLLAVLLSEGRNSRMVSKLREELQLVQEIYCNFSLQRESSLFTITAWLEPENLEEVENLILGHLNDLQTTGINDQELSRIRRLVCNEYAFSTETPNQLTGLYGYYNTIAQAELAVAYPQQIQSFDTQQLQQLAQQFLSPVNYAVTILKPC